MDEMNIISIDLPWKPEKMGRTALAFADLDGNIKVVRVSGDKEMVEAISSYAGQETIVLLDIPIHGCEALKKKNKNFRPVDKALLKQGISIQPSTGAQNRGRELKERISRGKNIKIHEIYPYAIYKFLAYLKDRELLQRLKRDSLDTLLDEGFRTYWPPKYKREKNRAKRVENMKYLYSLLTDTDIGLNFQIPLNYPDASSNLDKLSDEYDACLGVIVGIHFASDSRYACVAGDSNTGNILLLADRWLSERLSREVQVHHPEKRS